MNNNLLAVKTNLSTPYDPASRLTGANASWSALISPIIQNTFIVIGTLALFTIIFAGFQYITSDGDENKIKQATTMLNYAIIGLVLAGTAYLIVKIIGTATGFTIF
jgi:hypothetical protein